MEDREAERLPSAAGPSAARAASATVAGPQTRPSSSRKPPSGLCRASSQVRVRPSLSARAATAVGSTSESPSALVAKPPSVRWDGTQLSIESCVEALQLHARMVPPQRGGQFVPRSSPD